MSLMKSPKILMKPKKSSEGFQKGGIVTFFLNGFEVFEFGTAGAP